MNTEFNYECIISDDKKIQLFIVEITELAKTDPSIFCKIDLIYISTLSTEYNLKFKCLNYKNFNYLYNFITKIK